MREGETFIFWSAHWWVFIRCSSERGSLGNARLSSEQNALPLTLMYIHSYLWTVWLITECLREKDHWWTGENHASMFRVVLHWSPLVGDLAMSFEIAFGSDHLRPSTRPYLPRRAEDLHLSSRTYRHFLSIGCSHLSKSSASIKYEPLFVRLPFGSRSILHDIYMYE